jgi:NAD(P)-dependent dehydrogenase (short-subunit alcohol dehydrogenase family)
MAVIDLHGKVALVTGSARRVGKTIALELARQGMNQVIHHAHSETEAADTADQVRALGVSALVAKADLRQPDAIQRLFDTIRQQFGRLDLLVNSAATFQAAPILDISLEEWRSVLDVNLTAPFLCSQHAARLMQVTGGGAIINILDLSAFQPWKNRPHHAVSKAGLRALTEVLALSLGPDIRVNAVAAGIVLRPDDADPARWDQMGARLPLGHPGDPMDVAQAVVFLASQPFITGATLRVDGGDSLR